MSTHERKPTPPLAVFDRLKEKAISFAHQFHERRKWCLEIGQDFGPHGHDCVRAR
jgi:hypothetical protein